MEKTATPADIKKAYRQKAKILHPDINDSPDAHERFVLLNEAYEFLQTSRAEKVQNRRAQKYYRRKKSYNTNQDWEQKGRDEARQRANEHARMRYKAFTKTAFYRTTVSLNVIVDFLSVLGVLLILSGPIIGFLFKGIYGLLGGLFVIFITVHYWTNILIHNRPKLNFNDLGSAFVNVGKTRTFKLILVLSINLFFLFRIGFNTLMSAWSLITIYVVAVALGYLISKQIHVKFNKALIYLGIAPGLVNLFFLINFLFSTNESLESYSFKHEVQYTDNRWKKTSLIKLQGDMYDDIVCIRLFRNYDAMANAKTITYHFSDGLFGLRVLKSYEFK